MVEEEKKCAEWCGSGCTQKMYDEALWTAENLVKRLGDGWKTRVWENSGWHSEALSANGMVTVHPPTKTGRDTFSASFDRGRYWEYAATPKAAVAAVLAKVRAVADSLTKALEELDY